MTVYQQSLKEKAEMIQNKLLTWRRHIHRLPELSFQEKETAAYVKHVLEGMSGMKVQAGAGYLTAVVGTLTSGSGPTIAVRADMDALPIQELTGCSYQSKKEGIMHACGHDAHTAIVLGVAHLLSEAFEKKELAGTVKFLFQPAEEHVDEHGLSGAAYMVQDGVLNGVDAVIALHMSPENKLGEVKIHDGYAMANVDVFTGKIFASGGHGAYPHLGTDPIFIASQVLQALYGVTGRHTSPLDPVVISVGQIHGGSTSNVIPSEIEIQGTIRSFQPETRKRLHEEIENAFSIVKNLNADYQLNFIQEDPPLKNDAAINTFFKQSIQDLYPTYTILDTPFGLGGEDFAHMTSIVPGAMFFLGCADPGGVPRNLHTPYFDIDERVLPAGVSILTETVRRFLGGGADQ